MWYKQIDPMRNIFKHILKRFKLSKVLSLGINERQILENFPLSSKTFGGRPIINLGK